MLFLLSDDVSKHHIMNKCLLRFSLCVLFLFVLTRLEARHIVGGEISYVFRARVGNVNTYDFTMRLYRDCNSGGADYDDPAIIGIYLGNGGNLFQRITAPKASVGRVDNPVFPCLTSTAQICVQVGIYNWSASLPISTESYTIEYQRCCRNNSINNIVSPNSTGATYEIELTPAAQNANNNSAVFRTFPPTLICSDEPLVFDHSARDADGDQLVYEFCTPFSGGGENQGTGCDAVKPDPPCSPPIAPVVFVSPYSGSNPMNGNPIIRINPTTGVITGTPNVVGQFVVGVCVSEYRNGVLIGKLRRDFQFNVVPCRPTVRARIRSDTVINGNQYLLQVCGQNVVSIENLSFDRANITDFRWVFRIGGVDSVFRDWSPNISFPDTGVYRGFLYLNPGTVCGDTSNVILRVFNTPKARFRYSYDTCVAGPVFIRDSSTSTNGRILSWRYDFDNGVENVRNPNHQFSTPGLKNLPLHIVDEKGCTADTVQQINWQPAPRTLIIKPSNFKGCTPAHITFTNLSVPIDSTYKVEWTFGDSMTSRAISPVHDYQLPGLYTVTIKVTSPIGCKVSATYTNLISVRHGAVADFDFSPKEVTSFNRQVVFVNKSTYSQFYEWFFSNSGRSQLKDPTYIFRDTGVQEIKLVASNTEGCRDTIVKKIDVKPLVTYYLPNAFTPNEGGKNDYFRGAGYFVGMREFKMEIWNRWGELVFETNDPNEGWNGKKYNREGDQMQGVYLFVVSYRAPRGELTELKGFATLLR
jgi:gliding motility-associated-like protein